MSWVKEALAALGEGRTTQVRPHGGSMRGRIESGQLVTIAPVRTDEIEVNDVVLIKWKGNFLLHLVKHVEGDRLLIGNNIGKINGWASRSDVCGKVIDVSD